MDPLNKHHWAACLLGGRNLGLAPSLSSEHEPWDFHINVLEEELWLALEVMVEGCLAYGKQWKHSPVKNG